MRPILYLAALGAVLAGELTADELDDLVAKFQSERDKIYEERFQTASQFQRLKDERARGVVIALYRQEKDPNIQNILLRAVAGHDGPEVRAIVKEALWDFGKPAMQYTAAQSIAGKVDADLARTAVGLLADARTSDTLANHLRQALAGTKDEEAVKWLATQGLAASGKALLPVIEAVGRIGTPLALEALERLLRGRDPEIQRAALDALAGIDDPRVRELLEKLAKSRDPEIASRAVRGLGRWAKTDPELAAKLVEDLRSGSLERRLAAADALGEAGVTSAAGALVELLGDRAWQVRAAAILNLRRLRAKEAISPLIDLIEKEEGRLQGDVIEALEDLTGQEFGFSPANWRGWWNASQAAFVVPPKRERKPEAPEDGGGTTSGYYGIRVLSQRVVFVVDQSGSMTASAIAGSGATAGGAPGAAPPKNRLDVAKEQLEAVVRSFGPRVQFNVVFFESGFKVWKKGLVAASEANRREAIEYVRSQQPTGGTNIYDPLEAAILMEGVDTVFLLTDGDPGSGKFVAAGDILREIAKVNRARRVKINAIALGGARPLLLGLADQSGGTYVEP